MHFPTLSSLLVTAIAAATLVNSAPVTVRRSLDSRSEGGISAQVLGFSNLKSRSRSIKFARDDGHLYHKTARASSTVVGSGSATISGTEDASGLDPDTIFPVRQYADFQISNGKAGNAEELADAVFITPLAKFDPTTLPKGVIDNMETMREAAEDAETSGFNPAIDAAGGTDTTLGQELQRGKIMNKVAKLLGELVVNQLKQVQGSDTQSQIDDAQTKLTTNIGLDKKAAGQTAISFLTSGSSSGSAGTSSGSSSAASSSGSAASSSSPTAGSSSGSGSKSKNTSSSSSDKNVAASSSTSTTSSDSVASSSTSTSSNGSTSTSSGSSSIVLSGTQDASNQDPDTLFPVRQYADFQISNGIAGDAQELAQKVFVDPLSQFDPKTIPQGVIDNMETMREAAEDAETSGFNPAIDAAGGTDTTEGGVLQNGKIMNKALKLFGELMVNLLKQAQGDDTQSQIDDTQAKLTNNIALDQKASGQTAKSFLN